MRDIQEVFDVCDLVVRRAKDRIPEDMRNEAADRLAELRARATQINATLVVAIVGGTGSGKSSLLNAIAGEQVASTGRIRPYTREPMAWVPSVRDTGLEALLDELEISQRHRHEGMSGLALIDMPDVDSVVVEHRAMAEDAMARVDGLLWVLDPEKYHDPLLHDDFLAPLAGYAGQTAFVLNKIDLLDRQEFPRVAADVARSLAAAGYADPELFPVAAAPAGGAPPEGVAPLVEHFSARIDAKRMSFGKLLADVAAVIREIGLTSGVWSGASIRFDGRWTVTREAALAALRPTSRAPSEDALCRIEDLVASAAAEIGGPSGDEIRHRLGHEVILESLTAAQSAVVLDDRATARHALDDGVAVAIRELLWDRSYFAALVAQAHVGVHQVAHRFGAPL
ncbi:MAG TPA: GTPase [Acidimicrobiia bacterium]|jgi:energy-coupling factor transporter ATP-binding protein EcfA2|nr:GTPase [Acidimicrobiia bacterium]